MGRIYPFATLATNDRYLRIPPVHSAMPWKRLHNFDKPPGQWPLRSPMGTSRHPGNLRRRGWPHARVAHSCGPRAA